MSPNGHEQSVADDRFWIGYLGARCGEVQHTASAVLEGAARIDDRLSGHLLGAKARVVDSLRLYKLTMPKGTFRRVVLLGKYAFKLPRWKQFAAGMCSNRWEREMWQRWRPQFQWRTLCPVVYADPLGLLVVMPRALQPVPQDQVDALPDYYPDITSETKHEDFGRWNDMIVAVDYGLPFEDAVLERRSYYEEFSGGPAAELPR